jgi:hypothetical protein
VGETEMQQCFQKLQNRMDRIEEATVKSSSLEAKICDEITDFKKEVLKEIKKMGTKPTNHSADQDSFRQQLHEKDLIIQDLNKKLTLSAQDNKELQDQKKKSDDRESALNKSNEDFSQDTSNINLLLEIERLRSIAENNDDNISQLRAHYDRQFAEKDKQIDNLQDRLQNYMYDSNGNPWNKVETRRSSNSSSYTNTEISSKPKLQNYEVLFMHDSICHDIDIHRLLAKSDHKGVKQTTYTVNQATEFLEKVGKCDLIMVHVGINDLKSQSVETVFPKFVELINEAKSKANEVLISMLTPAREDALDKKVIEMNNMIYSTFYKEGFILCHNDNFCSRDNRIMDSLYYNETKISDEGIRVLAINFKRALFPAKVRRPQSNHTRSNRDERGRPRDRYYSPPRDKINVNNRGSSGKLDTDKLANSIAHAIALALK